MSEKAKKRLKITLNVLMYVFLALCIIAVIFTLSTKKDKDGVTVFGMQMRLVVSESMAKSEHTDVSEYEIKDIPVGSMVFVEVIPEDGKERDEWLKRLKVGDVLTFRYTYTAQITITHRIVDIRDNGEGGYFIDLKGDNKTESTADTLEQTINTSDIISPNYIIGKVTAQSVFIGNLVSTLRTPLGMILIVILPCLAIIVYDVVKIFAIVMEDRKKKDNEEKKRLEDEKQKAQLESERQRSEIEELKKKLAELENESGKIKDENEKNLED